MPDKRKRAKSTTYTSWPLIGVTKSVMRIVVIGPGTVTTYKAGRAWIES